MKKSILSIAMLLLGAVSYSQTVVSDSIIMGPGYANDVHYSLQNGTVSTVPNTNWHIAFRNGMVTDGIFINSTASVKGFLTNKDTSGWASMDSNNAKTEVFNTDTSWEVGAFNRTFDNAYSSWGIYNTITHKVTGDSLFILKVGANWVKVWVMEKDLGVWKVRLGAPGLDTTLSINYNDYKTSTLTYINALTGAVLNREPVDSTWDFKFTRYAALQSNGVYYPSTGVLNNRNVSAVKVTGVNKDTYVSYASNPFQRSISVIGADWKFFDNGTSTYKIVDSVVYFVKARNGNIWKMWFTKFAGASNSKSFFNKQKLYTVGLGTQNAPLAGVSLYPNPASDRMIVLIDNKDLTSANVRITDISGREISSQNYDLQGGLQDLSLDVSNLNNGLYILQVEGQGYSVSSKFMISR